MKIFVAYSFEISVMNERKINNAYGLIYDFLYVIQLKLIDLLAENEKKGKYIYLVIY